MSGLPTVADSTTQFFARLLKDGWEFKLFAVGGDI